MGECMTGNIGNGIVQYGKDDCTFTDGQYYSYLNLPRGISFGEIILMRIHQYSSLYSGNNNVWMYKKDDTTMTVSGASDTTGMDASNTSLPLYMSLTSGTAESVREVIIIVKE